LLPEKFSEFRLKTPVTANMKFPPMRGDSASWANAVFDEGAVHAADFY
jgi:hypothetical protein